LNGYNGNNMQEASHLKKMSVDKLVEQYHALSREIFQMHSVKNITRKVEKPHLFKQKKRERARVMTMLHEKGGRI